MLLRVQNNKSVPLLTLVIQPGSSVVGVEKDRDRIIVRVTNIHQESDHPAVVILDFAYEAPMPAGAIGTLVRMHLVVFGGDLMLVE